MMHGQKNIKFCDGDFGITPVDDITTGITFPAFAST